MKASTRRARIAAYFEANPEARVKDVADRFKVAMPTAYAIRKQVRENGAVKLAVQPDQPEVLDQEQANKYYQTVIGLAASAVQEGGDHYLKLGVQPWTAMEAWMTPEAFAGFLRGNAIKYLARADVKGGVEDLKKARHYLNKLIEVANRND
jgi:hypothetical protein